MRNILAGIAICVVCSTSQIGWADALKPHSRLGFVLVSMRTAMFETKYMQECRDGMAIGNDEIWWKSLSRQDRDRLTNSGEKEPAARRAMATRRGPHQEDVCWKPELVADPPMRIVTGSTAYGLNLDSETEGNATERTCKHQNFQSPDGEQGVDNQMYRLLGCVYGWRANGYVEGVADGERHDSSKGVWMIDITPLDRNESSQRVQVTFSRAVDSMPKSATGTILPFASYRVDQTQHFNATVEGTLTNGILTTKPVDIRLPFYGNRVSTEMYIRDMRLRLTIDPNSGAASGLLTGYHDLENWWDYIRKMGYLIDTAQFSCPAMYQAATDLADGFPDPATGKCTALSVAYQIKLVSGFVVRTELKPSEGVSIGQPPNTNGTLNELFPKRPPGINTRATPLGTVLTDIQGRTLYSAPAQGTASSFSCDSSCLRDWEPLQAPWSSKALGEWSLISRKDGPDLWAFRGQALYTCKRDSKPNVATCEGNGWSAVVATPAPKLPLWIQRQETSLGRIYADQRGHTLYILVGDRGEFEREICDQTCIDALWIPVEAASDAQTVGEWEPVAHGATKWWHYRGSPVYTYARDVLPGQFLGHLFGGASVSAKNYWSALPPEIADMSSPRQSRP